MGLIYKLVSLMICTHIQTGINSTILTLLARIHFKHIKSKKLSLHPLNKYFWDISMVFLVVLEDNKIRLGRVCSKKILEFLSNIHFRNLCRYLLFQLNKFQQGIFLGIFDQDPNKSIPPGMACNSQTICFCKFQDCSLYSTYRIYILVYHNCR